MLEPFAWSRGMAMVLIANPSQQPLCNGLVEGADEGFFFFENWSRNKLVKALIIVYLYTLYPTSIAL
jgi:hypothetical protein